MLDIIYRGRKPRSSAVNDSLGHLVGGNPVNDQITLTTGILIAGKISVASGSGQEESSG